PDVGDRLITFEELPAGTGPSDEYRDLGAVFRVEGGVRVTADLPGKFVPVSGDRVLGNPEIPGAPPGSVEVRFVAPGTAAPAVTGFVSLYLIDTEQEGAVAEALDPDGAVLVRREVRAGEGSRERVLFEHPRIARIRVALGQGGDTAALDQLAFTRPVAFNRPPSLAAPAPVVVSEGGWVEVILRGADPDAGQRLRYALVGPVPPGMTLDPATGLLRWNPGEAFGPGTYEVGVRATDDALEPASAEVLLRVEVREVNQPPAVASGGDRWVEPGTTYEEALRALDLDQPAQSLAYTLVQGPPGLTLSPGGLLRWPVPPGQVEPVTVRVQVEDPSGGVDRGTLTLRVPAALPNLAPTRLVVPAAADTRAPCSVTVREENLGRAPAAGPWTLRLWLSPDPVPDAGDTLLGEYVFTGAMLPGQFIERTVQFRAPGEAGAYFVIASTDWREVVAETSEADNLRVAGPLRVEAAYSAVVTTDLESGLAGTPVPLAGAATRRDGSAAAFEPVSVHLRVRGTRRVLSAITDGAGRFALVFRPLPGEAGEYTVGAAHPGDATAPAQDAFRILGMRAEPDRLAFDLPALARATNRFELVNLSEGPLTGLQVVQESMPPGLAVAAVVPSSLGGDQRVAVEVVASSLADGDTAGVVRLAVRSAEGPPAVVTLPVEVRSARARLVFDPPE
ncbi:MAG: putative Ig domain-containing protein, partial [Verrucomicrobiota bacterium]